MFLRLYVQLIFRQFVLWKINRLKYSSSLEGDFSWTDTNNNFYVSNWISFFCESCLEKNIKIKEEKITMHLCPYFENIWNPLVMQNASSNRKEFNHGKLLLLLRKSSVPKTSTVHYYLSKTFKECGQQGFQFSCIVFLNLFFVFFILRQISYKIALRVQQPSRTYLRFRRTRT